MQEQIQFTGRERRRRRRPDHVRVIRGALQAVCNEAGIVLMKGAMSMVINQGQDFSAAVLTPDGGLVMQGEEDFPCFITHDVAVDQGLSEGMPEGGHASR